MAGTGTVHLRPDRRPRLVAEDVTVELGPRHARAKAVSGVSFDVLDGETVGIVGESGCGKTTLLRALLQLVPLAGGSVRLDGAELTGLRERDLRRHRPALQMLFQDPVSALNPRRPVHQLVAEGARMAGRPTPSRDQVAQALSDVGLDPDAVWDRRRGALSGGQCQRVNLARALLIEPRVLLCDEPVSSLDVSVQAQILNLVAAVRRDRDISVVFVAHDLAVVRYVSDRVVVMYLGKVCEVAPAGDVFAAPAHPYTDLLRSSVVELDDTDLARPAGDAGAADRAEPADRTGRADGAEPAGRTGRAEPAASAGVAEGLASEPPSALAPPSGCRFRTRCPRADGRCATEEPVLTEIAPGHHVACHHPLTVVPTTVTPPERRSA
jgi:peptide/nickel transport system ATP-binding protein